MIWPTGKMGAMCCAGHEEEGDTSVHANMKKPASQRAGSQLNYVAMGRTFNWRSLRACSLRCLRRPSSADNLTSVISSFPIAFLSSLKRPYKRFSSTAFMEPKIYSYPSSPHPTNPLLLHLGQISLRHAPDKANTRVLHPKIN